MDFFNDHLLSILIFLPLGAAGLIALVPGGETALIRRLALGAALVNFAASLLLWTQFEAALPGFQFERNFLWIPLGVAGTGGIRYHVGLDGLSLLLVLLTTLLTPICLAASWTDNHKRLKEFVCVLLGLETGMIGVFVALDLVLFYVFWEAMLIPMFLLIGVWGGHERRYAALKFFLFTMVGSVLMLVAMLALHVLSKTDGFDLVEITELLATGDLKLSERTQWLLFSAFALAFAIKVPMFPLHTWLPDAHTQAPTAGSVMLAGVLLKMGGYGFLRFCLPLFPAAAHRALPLLVTLAVIGIIYGALCALAQSDVKKLVAYSSVSHLGVVMLGLFTFNLIGLTGGVLQMINHGVSTGALFLLVGMIYQRRHTRELSDFGGLALRMPVYCTLFTIVVMSSLGLPGLNGFVGELLVLIGVASGQFVHPIATVFAASGMVLGAIYMLRMVRTMFYGPLTNDHNRALTDLTSRELAVLAPLIALIFLMGVYPKPFKDVIHLPLAQLERTLKLEAKLGRSGLPARPQIARGAQ